MFAIAALPKSLRPPSHGAWFIRRFRAARDAVRIARSGLFPTVSVSPSIVSSRAALTGTAGVQNFKPSSRTAFNLPVDLSYQADLWGSIRRNVAAGSATAQASAAQLENAKLVFHAELVQDYFELRGADTDRDLLDRTVKSYEVYLQLTQDRHKAGVASGGDVAQAETQLATARAQSVDLGVARAQFEHAIAILTGRPPATLSIPIAT